MLSNIIYPHFSYIFSQGALVLDIFATKEAQEVMRVLETSNDEFPGEYAIFKEADEYWKAKYEEMRDAGCL